MYKKLCLTIKNFYVYLIFAAKRGINASFDDIL